MGGFIRSDQCWPHFRIVNDSTMILNTNNKNSYNRTECYGCFCKYRYYDVFINVLCLSDSGGKEENSTAEKLNAT